ncbi:MAG: hypothetical protein AB2693_13385 [Candidatus Thiodiazotropha sp.]
MSTGWSVCLNMQIRQVRGKDQHQRQDGRVHCWGKFKEKQKGFERGKKIFKNFWNNILGR